MEARRLADIRAGDACSARSLGSGYLIAPQLVLTARHAVVGDGASYPRIDVRVGHPRRSSPVWRDGEVCWVGPADTDVALVRLTEAVRLPDATPVRWGHLEGGRPQPYQGLGYPLLAEYADEDRGVEQLRGVLPPLATGPAGMLVLDQAAAPRARGDDSRAWSGVSGAAVFCDNLLVGVIVRDDAEFDNRRLHACPISSFVTDARFASLLSAQEQPALTVEEVPAVAADLTATASARLRWPAASDDALGDAGPAGGDGVWPDPGLMASVFGQRPTDAADLAIRSLPRPATGRGRTQLPPAPTAFVGREKEIHRLLALLDPHGPEANKATGILLTGMAGLGKTTLALRVAHEAHARGWFRGGVLFLNAHGYGPDQATSAGDMVGRLLCSLGYGDSQAGPEDALGTWHELLTVLTEEGRAVLVVVDDVSAAGQVAGWLPGTSRHRVVVTSRDALPDLDARLLPLPALSPHHATALIDQCLRIARADDRRFAEQSEDTLRLTELCGGLPLALRTVASLLRPEPTLSAGELADELADARLRLDTLSPNGSDAPVRAAFEVSYRGLPADQQRTFRSLALHPGSHFSSVATAALLDTSASAAKRTLRSLARVHLVEKDATGLRDAWSMHGLIRIYAQELASRHADESTAAVARLLDFYRERAYAVNRAVFGSGELSPGSAFARSADALSWLHSEHANVIAVGLLALSCGNPRIAVSMIGDVGEYMVHCGLGEELLPLSAAALRWTRSNARTVTMVNVLAVHSNALISAGRAEEAIGPLRSALGPTRSEPVLEGSVRLTLGQVYRAAGRPGEAASQCRAAVAIFEETEDPDSLSAALTALGAALRMLGDPRHAVGAHRRAAAAARLSGNLRRQAVCLNNLGNALSDMGEGGESQAAFQESVDALRDCGDQYLEITVSAHLAFEFRDAGLRLEAARTWSHIAVLCHGLADPEREFSALAEAGRDFHALEDFEETLEISRRALACSRAVENQTHVAQVMNNLACCLAETGDFHGAVLAHVRAALQFRAHSDLEEPRAADAQITLSLEAARRIADGRQAADALLTAAALARHAQEGGWDGRLRSMAGLRLSDAGGHEEAVAVFEEAAAIFASLGDRTQQGRTLNNLGISLRALARYPESAAAIETDLGICRAVGDREGEAISLLNLAETLEASGDHAGTSARRREALDVLVAVGADQETVDEVTRKLAGSEGLTAAHAQDGPRDADNT